MNKQAYLEETYNSAFSDELEKMSALINISDREASGIGDLIASGIASGTTLGAGYGFLKKKPILKSILRGSGYGALAGIAASGLGLGLIRLGSKEKK